MYISKNDSFQNMFLLTNVQKRVVADPIIVNNSAISAV